MKAYSFIHANRARAAEFSLFLAIALGATALNVHWHLRSDVYVQWDDGEYWLGAIRLKDIFLSSGLGKFLAEVLYGNYGRPSLHPVLGLPFLTAAGGKIQTANLLFTSAFTFAATLSLGLFLRVFLGGIAITTALTLFLATQSLFFWQQTMFMPELPYTTFVFAALALGIRQGRGTLALSGICMGLAFCVRPFEAMMLIGILGLSAMLLYGRELWAARKKAARAVFWLVPFLSLAVTWIVGQAGRLISWTDPIHLKGAKGLGTFLHDPGAWISQLGAHLLGAYDMFGYVSVGAFALLAAFSRPRRPFALGMVQLLAPLLVMYVMFEPYRRDAYERFAACNLFLFWILAARSIAGSRIPRLVGVPLAGVLSVLNLLAIMQVQVRLNEEFERAKFRTSPKRHPKIEHAVREKLHETIPAGPTTRVFAVPAQDNSPAHFSLTAGNLLAHEMQDHWVYRNHESFGLGVYRDPPVNVWSTVKILGDYVLIGPILQRKLAFFPMAESMLNPKKRPKDWTEEKRFEVLVPGEKMQFVLFRQKSDAGDSGKGR